MKEKKLAVLSLSGGMDSSTLLLRLLRKGYQVTTLSFNYGQKHKIELERAQQLVEYLNKNSQSYDGHRIDHMFYPIQHHIIDLSTLAPLLNSNLVQGNEEVPEGHYEENNMVKTVVPNRNKLFSSIIQSVALSLSKQHNGAKVKIAMGIHSGDHTIYPDTTDEFRLADYLAFRIGNWNSDKVDYYTPYMEGDKYTILKDGLKSCKKLGLDFDEVYKRTLTSYKPLPSGISDFKSASSVERIEAFMKLDKKDPVTYGYLDENGNEVIVDWDNVKKHVIDVLDSYNK